MENEKAIESYIKIKEKSQDDFEKNITYLSAGTLVLSLTFIEKIVPLPNSKSIWMLTVSWILLTATLLANLISQQLAAVMHDKTISQLYQNKADIYTKMVSRNRVLNVINWGTIVGLVTGIFFLVLFCSTNAYKMENDNKNIQPSNNDSLIKGRTITIQPPSTNASPSESSSSGQNSGDTQGANSTSDASKR